MNMLNMRSEDRELRIVELISSLSEVLTFYGDHAVVEPNVLVVSFKEDIRGI